MTGQVIAGSIVGLCVNALTLRYIRFFLFSLALTLSLLPFSFQLPFKKH